MGFIPVTSTGVCLSACAHSARVLGPPCRAAVQSTAKKVWARRRAAAQHAWPLRICCCRREAMLERQCQLSASELLTAREQTLQENEKSFWLLPVGPGVVLVCPVDAGKRAKSRARQPCIHVLFSNNCVLQERSRESPHPAPHTPDHDCSYHTR